MGKTTMIEQSSAFSITKICNACKEEKFITDFPQELLAIDGRADICIRCRDKENAKIYSHNWLQSDNGKVANRKRASKRRGLGSISLNKPFSGSEFHHYNKEHGMHIPAEIHQGIRHNVFTGQNMEAINKEAFEFLEWEMIEKQWAELEEGRGEY